MSKLKWSRAHREPDPARFNADKDYQARPAEQTRPYCSADVWIDIVGGCRAELSRLDADMARIAAQIKQLAYQVEFLSKPTLTSLKLNVDEFYRLRSRREQVIDRLRRLGAPPP